MKSINKILVAIIVLLLLLAIAGGAFAYAYMATDIFRSDKELFFKYFSQIAEEDGFFDKGIQQFNEKKKQTPYENSGDITVEMEYPDDSINDVIEKVNDLSIEISGKVDKVNQKVEQNVNVDYGNDVVFPISYRQDGDKFGLQFGELSEQYIAVKNENLDELVKEILSASIGEDTESMEDFSIDVNTFEDLSPNTFEMLQFTDDEINQLKQIYGNILNEQLADDNFSKEKNGTSESYTLELTAEQIKNIVIKMLETSKENTLILDKLNDIISELNSESEDTVELDTTMIDSLIESINEEETSDLPNFKITIVQNNKKLSKIIIPQEQFTLSIEKDESEDSLSYKINFEIKTDIVESSSILLDESEVSELMQANVYFNVQYNGLQNLSNVQENYELGLGISSEEMNMKYDYKISNDTEFKESISIEELNEENAIFLNGREGSQIITFLTNVGTKLLEINKNQMAELGVEEYGNPLLYANPISGSLLEIMRGSSGLIENTDFSEQEKEFFNGQFVTYQGEDVRGSVVNMMVARVQSSNLSSQDSDGRMVKVTLDGMEISEKVDTSKSYSVEPIYDDNGFISEMKVTTKN